MYEFSINTQNIYILNITIRDIGNRKVREDDKPRMCKNLLTKIVMQRIVKKFVNFNN